LLAVSIASPLFIILLVEAVVFVISDGRNKLRKYFHFTTSIYLMYIVSFVIATFIMEVLKCAFARLRPHYLSVCQPNWKEINCTDPNAYIESKCVNCLGTNMHRIRIGRQSFPSGHTSAAVLLFLFFYFYLKGMLPKNVV
uniref:AcidPPc domain-containing protein n=1 Tax=Brugia timori TaxID=42155 RepID=A0A0R3QCV3_9BILA